MTEHDETRAHGAIAMRVNGAEAAVEADPDTPLLYVLRNDLGLTSVRFGCGVGMCGACTVTVDGRARHSCDMPVWSAKGCAIETVEGLVERNPPHPLMKAFVDEQAGQCGYCLAGILMRAKALLDENPQPSRAEIIAALDGNLCRCGTHVRILRAVERAAAAAAVGVAIGESAA